MKKKPFLIALFLGMVVFSLCGQKLMAEECDLSCWQNKINEYETKINELQGQAQTLSSTISYLNSKIAKAEAEIARTEIEIELLKKEISELSFRISDLNIVLDQTAKRLKRRIVSSYKRTQIKPFYYLLSSRLSPASLKYMYAAEQQDKDLLLEMEQTRLNYDQQKDLKEDKQAQQEALKQKLANQRASLTQQQRSKQDLLAQTQNDEQEFQNLLTEAKRQLAAVRVLVSSRGGAEILSSQTFCDNWGCYYNQRDESWGRMGLGSSSLSVAEYGCLVSSVAMVAKHYGHDIDPADIAAVSSAFFSPNEDTALLFNDITIKGINIQRIHSSKTIIDGELAAGKPVIVGLYSGPAHFVVLKSGSDGNYIMNDPWYEGGHDIPFSSHYGIGDIVRADRIIL